MSFEIKILFNYSSEMKMEFFFYIVNSTYTSMMRGVKKMNKSNSIHDESLWKNTQSFNFFFIEIHRKYKCVENQVNKRNREQGKKN